MKRIGSAVLIGVALVGAVAYGTVHHDAALPPGIAIPGLPSSDRGSSEVTLGTAYLDGAGTDTTAVVGRGGTVRITAGYGVRYTGSAPGTPHVVLERSIGSGPWRRTAAAVRTERDEPLTAVTPAYTATGERTVIRYRLVSGASVSRVLRVVYENPARYTGMAATVYRYAAPYCPSTAVHVADLSGREAGDYRTGALLIRVDSSVGRTGELRPIDQRALALHECSHERQWLDYGATADGRKAMTAAAARIFAVPGGTIDPIEHAADCGAQALNPGGYLGYGGVCTAAQLAAGRRLLLGGRY